MRNVKNEGALSSFIYNTNNKIITYIWRADDDDDDDML